jgi:hypothetical protein
MAFWGFSGDFKEISYILKKIYITNSLTGGLRKTIIRQNVTYGAEWTLANIM